MPCSPARRTSLLASLLAVALFTGCLDGTTPFDFGPPPVFVPAPVDPNDATVLKDLRLVLFNGWQMADHHYGDSIMVAAGGRVTLQLRMVQPDGSLGPFGRPYSVIANTWDGTTLQIISQDADELVLGGVRDPSSAGTGNVNTLVITEPNGGVVLGRFSMVAAPVDQIGLAQVVQWVFMPGATATAGYSPTGAGFLVDETAKLTGEGITQTAWNQFRIDPATTPGTHTVTGQAGDHEPVAMTYTVVAGPDRVAYDKFPVTIDTVHESEFCFYARLGNQNVHAVWSFTSSNGPAEANGFHEGCVLVHPAVKGPLLVTASSGSATVTKQFTVH